MKVIWIIVISIGLVSGLDMWENGIPVSCDPNKIIEFPIDPNATFATSTGTFITIWEPPTTDCPIHGKQETTSLCFGSDCTKSYCGKCWVEFFNQAMKNFQAQRIERKEL